MAYMGGTMRWVDGSEYEDEAISAGKLCALLQQLSGEMLVRVNPVTRCLIFEGGYLDIAEEKLEFFADA